MARGFEQLTKTAQLPKRATKGSAGYDFFLPETIAIAPNGRIFIETNVRAYMEEDVFLALYVRSSLAMKYGITLINQTGIIDSDYYNNPENLGNIIIGLKNETNNEVVLEKGMRFVQGVFMAFLKADEDEEFNNRIGGIGSTQ